MAFIPALNTVMFEIIQSWDGQICENTIYVEKDAPWTTTEMLTFCADIKAVWVASMIPNQAANLSLTMIRATDLSTDSAPKVEYVTGLPVVGSNASPSLPNNVSMAITFLTLSRGRSYRGRNYICGLAESGVTGNVVGAGTVSAWLAGYAALQTSLDDANHKMVVVSRYHDKAPRATAVMTPVNSFRSDGIIDSQRRRLPGRGQ